VDSEGIDGEVLAVILDDPNQMTANTIVLLFGAQATTGDTFSLELASPINLSDPELVLDMSLGISFGAQRCTSRQYNIVDVNGTRLSTSAGGEDDGICSNGALLTVGGLDDSNANPTDPLAIDNFDPRQDDELYNLIPFVSDGDSSIEVFTNNPSGDDNIFFASFTASIASNAPEIDYFALGDSIASGHGLIDDGPPCRRSDRAYPHKVSEMLQTRYATVNTYFLACSGATAHRSSGTPLKTLKSQVDVALSILSKTNLDHSRPVLISLTFGMNDFGWTDPIQMAANLNLPDNEFITLVLKSSAQIKEDMQEQLDRFADHPNVSFVITTYPNPINRESVFFSLLPEVLGRRCAIRPADKLPCYIRTEIAINALNEVLTQLEQPGKVKVTQSLQSNFHDHASPHRAESPNNSCGSAPPEASDSWIQYPGEDNINSDLPENIRKRLGITEPFGDCFHPNDAGAQEYATEVNEAAQALGR
jgi:lysophospholipase L1-like esterase